MKQVFYFLLAIALFPSCKKDDTETIPPTTDGKGVGITYILLGAYHGYDTTNHIENFQFMNDALHDYYYSQTSRTDIPTYSVKYIGGVSLFSTSSFEITRYNQSFTYPVNPALKGKDIFEIRNASTNELVKTIKANNDCTIECVHSDRDNLSVTASQIRENFDYFLTEDKTKGRKFGE